MSAVEAAGVRLYGVSCTSPSACVAVGANTTIYGDALRGLAERWDGTTWAIQPTPSPASAFDSVTLSAVSCPSVSMCVAVGSNDAGPLTEHWNGQTWSVQPDPGPAGARLTGISCASPSSCIAVGPGAAAAALIEHWDGTTWTAEQPPATPGGNDSLHAISCPLISRCVAVGEFDPVPAVNGAPDQPLVEVWDGISWSSQVIPITNGGSLTGIDCPTPDNCVAVGSTNGNPQTALAEGWDGGNWTRQATQNLIISHQLRSVSCTMTTQCTSVGWSGATAANTKALAEAWDGTSWQVQPVPVSASNTPLPVSATLGSIACPVPGMCMAVGTTASGGLAELYR